MFKRNVKSCFGSAVLSFFCVYFIIVRGAVWFDREVTVSLFSYVPTAVSNCSSSSDTAKILASVIYLEQIWIQAILICVPPTMLEDEVLSFTSTERANTANHFQSVEVATSAYLCDWHNIKLKTLSTDIGLLIMRAQSPIVFTAAGFFPVNVESLTKARHHFEYHHHPKTDSVLDTQHRVFVLHSAEEQKVCVK